MNPISIEHIRHVLKIYELYEPGLSEMQMQERYNALAMLAKKPRLRGIVIPPEGYTTLPYLRKKTGMSSNDIMNKRISGALKEGSDYIKDGENYYYSLRIEKDYIKQKSRYKNYVQKGELLKNVDLKYGTLDTLRKLGYIKEGEHYVRVGGLYLYNPDADYNKHLPQGYIQPIELIRKLGINKRTLDNRRFWGHYKEGEHYVRIGGRYYYNPDADYSYQPNKPKYKGKKPRKVENNEAARISLMDYLPDGWLADCKAIVELGVGLSTLKRYRNNSGYSILHYGEHWRYLNGIYTNIELAKKAIANPHRRAVRNIAELKKQGWSVSHKAESELGLTNTQLSRYRNGYEANGINYSPRLIPEVDWTYCHGSIMYKIDSIKNRLEI